MKFNDFYFEESINDKNLFNAVFLAGGPGSGKTLISNLAFGGEGTVTINSDMFTEMMFKRDAIPFVFDPKKKELYARQQEIRNKARDLASQRIAHAVNGMLPIVVDGTGRNFDKIKRLRESLNAVGYDTYMVFVNTSLDAARERNQQRARKIDDKMVVQMWHDVQDNLGHFQDLFGGENFIIVDNSELLTDDDVKKLEIDLTRKVRKFLQTPVHNPIGQEILKDLKERGKQYMSDLVDLDKEQFKL